MLLVLVAMLIADKLVELFYFAGIPGSTIYLLPISDPKIIEKFVTESIYLVKLKLMGLVVLSGQLPLKAAVLQKFSN